ncbi:MULTISPECIES: BTAD domain-containing putative transcriptional regulator [unclassified Blastococcus]
MQVTVLGGLGVRVDGVPADLGGPKPQALLALLVAAEGRPVSVPHLVDQIWGEDPPARAEASLQSYVARLRKELEPARRARATTDRLRTHPGGYSLAVGPADVDARRFADLVRRARAERSEALFDEALALWGGEPYAGLTATSPALAAEAVRLTELRLSAAEDAWELRLDRGHRDAAAELEHLVRLHPARERLWGLLALAQYRAARQADALDTLRRARAHLAGELGIDPGPELRQLEAAVLRQDPALERRPAARATAPAVPASVPAAGPAAPPAVATGPEPPPAAPLHGRDAELAAVDRVLAAAAAGRGRVVVVLGEPGIGKTRFTDEVLARAAARGARTGRGAWEPDGSPPLAGWTAAAREALGREGVLAPTPGEARDAAAESYRLAEALLAGVGDGPPVVLVLDDVHWADTDSLRLVRRVGARLAPVPLVLVVALRAATADTPAPVADLLGALARLDPLRLELAGLDAGAVTAAVAAATGIDLPGGVADELVARTSGNPFFVTEVVRLLAAEGALTDADAPAWRSVPRGVRDVVRQRLAGLPPSAGRVLAVAAVAGRGFDLPVVEQAAGRSGAEVDEALEAALALGLVEEEGPGRYRFPHALVRDAVYEALSAPARARAHADVAAALEDWHASRVADHAAELAEHYRLAGPAHARSAWSFARRAADAAAARSAHDEARRLFALAAELQAHDPAATDAEREAVTVGLARALRRLGRPLEAWPLLAAAGASALRREGPGRAADVLLEISEGAVWGWRIRGQVDSAAIALWHSLLDAPDGDLSPVQRARVQAALTLEYMFVPEAADTSTALLDAAITAARGPGFGDRDRAAVLQVTTGALTRPDLLHRRTAVADEMVALNTRTGDEPGLAYALTQRATVRGELGLLDDAGSDLARASLLAERHAVPQVLLIAGWGLALLRQARGDLAGAEADVVRLERLAQTLAMAGVGVGLAQLTTIRWAQGRLAELEPELRVAAEYQPNEMRDAHALALIAAGRAAEARVLLGAWTEQPPINRDYLWLSLTVLRAWVWLELHAAGLAGDEAVDDLRRALEPYADRWAVGGLSALFAGSVGHTLARLAAAGGDLDAARRHAESAVSRHRAAGLDRWAERTAELLAAYSGRRGAVDEEGVLPERPA